MKHLEIALSEYGQKEIAGVKHNPRIINYAKEAGFNFVNDDETPWCSIFVNWVCLKAGVERSYKPNARSWLNVGEAVAEPQLGDIVILKRGNSEWQGHVGIYINSNGGAVYVLGGNQANQVNISAYLKTDVLGYRRL